MSNRPNNSDIDQIIRAMMASNVPACEAGSWSIRKMPSSRFEYDYLSRYYEVLPDGEYTFLHNMNAAYLGNDLGECVMEDTPHELRTHLDFALKARGRVLISGLGLGCVVRGVLCNQDVEEVVVLERDQRILDSVLPHMPDDPRLKVEHECALRYASFNDRYDFAWHDIWSDPDKDEEPLPLLHTKLLMNHSGHVRRQGAWGMPRTFLAAFKRQSWWYTNPC